MVAVGSRPRVFLDTCTIKFSTVSETILRPRLQTLEFAGKAVTLTVHDICEENPNDRIRDPAHRAEVDLLPKIATLASDGVIELLIQSEVLDELARVTILGRRNCSLLRAPKTTVSAPLKYSRILSGRKAQVGFLLGIRHDRYLDWRRVCGANQGDSVNPNQLIDAFHLWTAENAGASDFLTCDFKLIRTVRSNRRFTTAMRLTRPSELIAAVSRDGIEDAVIPAG